MLRDAVRAGELRGRGAAGSAVGAHGPRATVFEQVDVGAEDPSFCVQRNGAIDDVGARVGRRHQVLATILGPLDGPVQLHRREDRDLLFALREHLLTETAAHVLGLHADVVLGNAGQPREHGALVVR